MKMRPGSRQTTTEFVESTSLMVRILSHFIYNVIYSHADGIFY